MAVAKVIQKQSEILAIVFIAVGVSVREYHKPFHLNYVNEAACHFLVFPRRMKIKLSPLIITKCEELKC